MTDWGSTDYANDKFWIKDGSLNTRVNAKGRCLGTISGLTCAGGFGPSNVEAYVFSTNEGKFTFPISSLKYSWCFPASLKNKALSGSAWVSAVESALSLSGSGSGSSPAAAAMRPPPTTRARSQSRTAADASKDLAARRPNRKYVEPPELANEQHWVKIQVKTFTRWANAQLSERLMKIDNLAVDLQNGILLINLMEIISNTSFGRYVKKPRLEIQKLSNLNMCVDWVDKNVAKLVNIGASDIFAGNIKIILGLLWTTILRYQIQAAAEGGTSPKRALLEWINKQIKPYESRGVDQVKNFTKGWVNGKALAALTDSLEPGCIDIAALSSPLRDLDNAIRIADESFGIPSILDAEDIIKEPDEHSMMTYLAYFREYVEGEGARKKKAADAARRRAEEEAARRAAAVKRALKWKATGPGVTKGFANRWLPFELRNNAGDHADIDLFSVVCSGLDEQIGGELTHGRSNEVDGRWRANYPGEYTVEITLDGQPIAHSPFTVPTILGAMAAKSYCEGPGLKGARDDQVATFTVYAKDKNGDPVPFEDSLVVAVEGPHSCPVKVKDNGDGSYSVEYQTKPGDYAITVTIDGEVVKPTPCEVYVQPGKNIDGLLDDVNDLRRGLALPNRDMTEEDWNSSAIEDDLKKEKKDLSEIQKLVEQIQGARKELDKPPRIFSDDDLTGLNAVPERTKERDDLYDLLERKKKVLPLCDEINRLRKHMELPPRDFTEEELIGPTALDDRGAELDHLKKIVPLYDEIGDLRGQLEMPKREYVEDDLTGLSSEPQRIRERDDLLAQLGNKNRVAPLLREIQKLRENVELSPREFTDDEKFGSTAFEDRTRERDGLKDVNALVDEIQRLRKKMDLPPKVFAEDELTGPDAVFNLTNRRDHLKSMVPLKGEIETLRKGLDMDDRKWAEPDLTGADKELNPVLDDRIKERDDLLHKKNIKRQTNPLIAEIQRLRKGLERPPKDFTDDEIWGPTAIKDRTEERDHLKRITPVVGQIHDLRKKLGMPGRTYDEDEITGPTSYPDRVAERDGLLGKMDQKGVVEPLCDEINALRKRMDLPPREFTKEELESPTAAMDLTAERDHLRNMVPLFDQIHDLRGQLEMSRREFEEDELADQNTAEIDRKQERDDLLDRLRKKHAIDPLVEEIQRLRRELDLPVREFDDDELWGDTAIEDRTKERDDLREMLDLTTDIHVLRKKAEVPRKTWDEDELTGLTAIEDRKDEISTLKDVIPLQQEIHGLRKQLEMSRRDFEEDEVTGKAAVEDRTDERDELKDMLDRKNGVDPLVAEIQRLRGNMDMSRREFDDDELNGPTAVEDRTAERDDLKAQVPVYDEINKLRRKLEMPQREFEDDELYGRSALPDRIEERDNLRDMLVRKKITDPLLAQIQRMRRNLNLDPREFTEVEKTGPTAVEDRTEERDHLKKITPVADEIGSLRRKLEMPPREYSEDELTGSPSYPDRCDERDGLRENLDLKKNIDPLLREIQRLRKKVDLPPKEWSDDELNGLTALEDRTKERDDLKEVVPLATEIHTLHRKLEMPRREFEEEELTGPDAVEDRTDERDRLRDMLEKKRQVEPLCKQIQKIRKNLDVPPRDWDQDELYGDTAVEDRRQERDDLREVVPLVDQIHDLRKQLEMSEREFEEEDVAGSTAIPDRTQERDDLLDKLERLRALEPLIQELQGLRKQLSMDPREFEDGELEANDADIMLKNEIADLKRLLYGRDEADRLAKEIQGLHTELDMPARIFTEEELDAKDAVPKLTKERDGLLGEVNRRRAVGDLPEQIDRLRDTLEMKPKEWPEKIPISKVPALVEERDDLQDECDARRRRADSLLKHINRLWKELDIPQSDRPDLSLDKDEIPTKKWLGDAEDEHDRLRKMMRDKLQGKVDEKLAVLNKLWDQLHVPERDRAKWLHKLGDLYTQESLEAMDAEARRLLAQLLAAKKLVRLILKRKAFIQKMLDFEVVASDPKRLFKNSVRLNKEEQFRREAYPSLLKIEDAIRDGLQEFEEQTGEPFEWEGDYYLVTLEKEIEERNINEEIFGIGQGKKNRKRLKNQVKKKVGAKSTRGTKSTKSTRSPTRKTKSIKTKSTKSPGSPGRNLPPGFKSLRK